jgi:AsmA protein
MSDATDTAPAPRAPESTLARLEDLELGDVRIENGALRYSDARSGSAHEFGSINVDLALKSISSPLEAKGSASWKAKKIDFDATLTSVKAVLEERPAKLALAITSEDVEGAFDGTASFKDTLDAEGTLSGKSPSVRSLAKWLGTELSPSKGFGPLTAKGLVRGNDKTISLSNAEIALDGATARGQITLETAGTRPLVKANLKLTELNLNTYMSGGDAGPRAAAAPASPPKQDPASEAPAWSIDDLLEREQPGPKVKGFRERAGWSEDAIDLSALGLVDADAKLSVGRLFVRDIKFDQSELTVALKGGIFKTTFDDVRLYEGRGRGFVAIDASSPKTANVGANLTLEGISALPLLKDGAGIDWVSGKGRLAFALAGQGTNQRQIVETLNGKLDFSFTDGALVGFNIPQMVRGLGQGHLTELKSAPTEKTDFSELAATWTVAAGVAQNQDLRLISPLLRVTGAGAVMLPPREVDYTLKPKLVADLAGQGGQQNLAGLEVPVRVHGPWGKPKLKPDLAAVFKDPKAVDTIKEIGKQFKGKSASEIVKGLFGGGGAPSGDAQGAETQAGDQPGEKLPDQSQKR